MATDNQTAGLNICYCYVRADKKLVKAFDKHLTMWKREELITIWQTDAIPAGADWENEYYLLLRSADLILFFVSADFLDTEFCYGPAMEMLIERHQAGVARIIPILLSPSTWEFTLLSHLAPLPANGKTMIEQKDQDAAFADVVLQIQDMIEQWQRPSQPDAKPFGKDITPESLETVLRKYRYLRHFYVGASIPSDKLVNARAVCHVPEDEVIRGLLDLTVFGSAKNCLLLGNRCMYYHHMNGKPRFETIRYVDFPLCTFRQHGLWSIDTGNGSRLTLSGNSLPPQEVCEMLTMIKHLFTLAQQTHQVDQDQSAPAVFFDVSSSHTPPGEEVPSPSPDQTYNLNNTLSRPYASRRAVDSGHVKPSPLRKWLKVLVISMLLLALFGSGLLLRSALLDAIGNAHALATATAQMNATATATANIVAENPDPYPPFTGKLALYDPLTSPLHWSANANSDYGSSCQFVNGFLDVRQSKSPRLWDCVDDQDFVNFAIEVHMRILKGNCGISLRYTLGYVRSQTDVYLVCLDGTYSILSFTSSGEQGIGSSYHQAIHKGENQLNLLALVANRSQLTFYVNGISMQSVSTSTPRDCKIGLIALDLSTPDEVAYTNAKVWAL